MDLREYFPVYANERLAGLDVIPMLQDFGRSGYVDVSSEGSIRNTPSNRMNEAGDQAHTPSIPLRNIPVSVTFPLNDIVSGPIYDHPSKIRQLTRELKHLHSIIDGKRDFHRRWLQKFQKGKRVLEKIYLHKECTNEVQREENSLPLSVRTLCNRYTELAQHPHKKKNFNALYTGGTMACAKADDNVPSHLLVHAEGPELKQVCLTEVVESKPLLKWRDFAQRTVDPVFQLETTHVDGNVLICTRHKDSCVMFSVITDSVQEKGIAHLGTQKFTKLEMPTAVSISPFALGECLVATNKGSVYIWSVSDGIQKIIAEKKQRFSCKDNWYQVQHGCHPRQLIVADQTSVEIFDHRGPFNSSCDLFALPSKHLLQRERVLAIHTHDKNFPFHFVATDGCLLLLDQRFPGTPVIQWHPDLKGPLQYVVSADFKGEQVTAYSGVLVASQYPPEAMLYPFVNSGGHPVAMHQNPWRLSRIGDMSGIDDLAVHTEHVMYEKRFATSLSGVAVASGIDSECLWIYQSDAYGEIFYQCCETSVDSHISDETYKETEEEDDLFVSAEVQKHLQKWLSQLQHQMDSLHVEWITRKNRSNIKQITRPKELSQPDNFDNSLCTQCSSAITSEVSRTNCAGMCSFCWEKLHLASTGKPGIGYTVPHLHTDAKYLNKCAQQWLEYSSLSNSNVDTESTRNNLKHAWKEKQKTAREKKKFQLAGKQRDLGHKCKAYPAPSDGGQEKHVIDDMIHSLLEPSLLPESIPDEEYSMDTPLPLSPNPAHLSSDRDDKHDDSFQEHQADSQTVCRTRNDTVLSEFVSLSDDEDFLSHQEIGSFFSPSTETNGETLMPHYIKR